MGFSTNIPVLKGLQGLMTKCLKVDFIFGMRIIWAHQLRFENQKVSDGQTAAQIQSWLQIKWATYAYVSYAFHLEQFLNLCPV